MPTVVSKKRATKKTLSKSADSPAGGVVERIHNELRTMAITFQFRPGERLNEAILAKELGVSRTPLREALNRLSGEGFLTFSVNQGFYRKPLDVKEIFDLYEFRQQMEIAAIRMAVERANDAALQELEDFAVQSADESTNRTVDQLISLDEEFHERLVRLTGNVELVKNLRNVNARIQYVRWVDMNGRRADTQSQHKQIVRALRERKTEECVRLMNEHIGHRIEQIIEKVEKCYGRIYMGGQTTQ